MFSIERVPALFERAREMLRRVNVRNVSLLLGDGTLGWREYAPFDAIVVSAGAPEMPPALTEQLAPGGRLVAPVGSREEQTLTLYERNASGGGTTRRLSPVRFVPLLGSQGWAE